MDKKILNDLTKLCCVRQSHKFVLALNDPTHKFVKGLKVERFNRIIIAFLLKFFVQFFVRNFFQVQMWQKKIGLNVWGIMIYDVDVTFKKSCVWLILGCQVKLAIVALLTTFEQIPFFEMFVRETPRFSLGLLRPHDFMILKRS